MKRFWLLLLVLPLQGGCFLFDNERSTTTRSQIEEPEPEPGTSRTIRNVAMFDAMEPVHVHGVGLVTNLQGTGSPTPPGDLRTELEERMKKERVANIAELLESDDTAVVFVSGTIKPGTRKNDLIDVEVTLPPNSKVKSLRGGILQRTPLQTFSSTASVREFLKNNEYSPQSVGNRVLRGHESVVAQGRLQPHLQESISEITADEPWKNAYVWQGGQALHSRSLFLSLNTDSQRYVVAETIAVRINKRFLGTEGPDKLAEARQKEVVGVAVPPAYRLNHPRYMRVVAHLPLDQPEGDPEYVKMLTTRLSNPATAASAAIALEAIGKTAIPILRAELKSQYPFVRFYAAEALAYMGESIGVDEIMEGIEQHPVLEAYGLSALAALDDAASIDRLEKLLSNPKPTVRQGAFRALVEIAPQHPVVHARPIGRAFYLHHVPVEGTSMIHVQRHARPEIVIYGEIPKILPPFSATVGPNLTITCRPGDTVATISRYTTDGADPTHVQSTLEVSDVIQQAAQMGITYQEAVELLVKLQNRKAISTTVVFDAIPRLVPIQKLEEAAALDPWLRNEMDLLTDDSPTSSPKKPESWQEQ
ncbi:MAG: flagellar basal body P-ring protein FlgI [Zavarzinella sp.]